jgi:hypothetical protein
MAFASDCDLRLALKVRRLSYIFLSLKDPHGVD